MIESKVVDPPGRRVRISARSDDGYFQNVENHAKEMFPLAALARRHAGNGLILDVGGNIGLSCIALANVCPGNTIIVFEPSPSSAALIRKNLIDNDIGNVIVVQAAASDKPGILHLNEGQTSGFSFIWTSANLDQPEASLTEVPVIVPDGFIDGNVTFIKIDVEGHEPNVIAGMKRIIERFSPVIYTEFNAWCLTAFGGYSIAALSRSLFDVFEVFLVSEQGELRPIGVNAKGFVYKVIVERAIEDIALKLRVGKTVPSVEGMTLAPEILAELIAFREVRATAVT
jgi:FkbM family methyltransferase